MGVAIGGGDGTAGNCRFQFAGGRSDPLIVEMVPVFKPIFAGHPAEIATVSLDFGLWCHVLHPEHAKSNTEQRKRRR